jgi:hypothetical protein
LGLKFRDGKPPEAGSGLREDKTRRWRSEMQITGRRPDPLSRATAAISTRTGKLAARGKAPATNRAGSRLVRRRAPGGLCRVELNASAIAPSFGSTTSVPPFAPLAPLGWFARFTAPTAALRLPASPPRSRAALARWFRLAAEKTGAPKFLGGPRHTCPGQRPRWSLPEQASAASPLRLALSVLPSKSPDSSASTSPVFRGPIPQPACSLSTLRVGRYLPLTQDSLSAGGLALAEGIQPAGSLAGFCMLWFTYSPPGRGLLGARGTGRAARPRGHQRMPPPRMRLPARTSAMVFMKCRRADWAK